MYLFLLFISLNALFQPESSVYHPSPASTFKQRVMTSCEDQNDVLVECSEDVSTYDSSTFSSANSVMIGLNVNDSTCTDSDDSIVSFKA